MIKKIIFATATGLATIVVGCDEQQTELEGQEEIGQVGETEYGLEQEEQALRQDEGATFEEEQRLDEQQQMAGTEQQQGASDIQQQQQREQDLDALVVMTTVQPMEEPTQIQSQHDFNRTMQNLQRELRSNQLEVAGRVRLETQQQGQQQARGTEQEQQRQQRQAQQQQGEQQQGAQQQLAQGQEQDQQMRREQRMGKGGQQATAQPERAELVLFADPQALQQAGDQPSQVLQLPTAILVYEDAQGQTYLAYREGGEQNVGRVIEAAAGTEQTAAKPGEQQGTQQQTGAQQQGTEQQSGMQQQGAQQQGTQQQGAQQQGSDQEITGFGRGEEQAEEEETY